MSVTFGYISQFFTVPFNMSQKQCVTIRVLLPVTSPDSIWLSKIIHQQIHCDV